MRDRPPGRPSITSAHPLLFLLMMMMVTALLMAPGARGIKIRPSECSGAAGEPGTCMFVWQCIKRGGEQLGPCMDRFLVGACCRLPAPLTNPDHDNLVPGASGPAHQDDLPSKVKPLPSTSSTSTLLGAASTLDVATTLKLPPPSTTTSTTEASPVEPATTTMKPADDNYSACGIQSPFPKSKVVGGTHASFGEFPWQVSVRRSSFFGFASTHRCGGTVISASWIATAAHCVDDLLLSQIRIRAGEFDFSSSAEPAPHQERGCARKVVHPRYNFFSYESDLALLRLDSPLRLRPHVRPICLPQADADLTGRNATITGWGRLSEGGSLPQQLQRVQVPIVSNEACARMFRRAGRHEAIPDIFLCAGYEGGGRDSCQGDSGGPLQVRGDDGRWVLAGVISWGIGCAEPNMPGVCTKVAKFVPWIGQHLD